MISEPSAPDDDVVVEQRLQDSVSSCHQQGSVGTQVSNQVDDAAQKLKRGPTATSSSSPTPSIPRTRLPRLPMTSHVQQLLQQDNNIQNVRTMQSTHNSAQYADLQNTRAPLPKVVYVAPLNNSKPSKKQLLSNQKEQPLNFVASIVAASGPLVYAFLILAGVCSLVLCVVAATS